MLITVDSRTAMRLLRIYGINPPVVEEGASHQAREMGIPVTIDGVVDPKLGRVIRMKIDGHRSARMCPLTQYEAQTLIYEFHEKQLLAADPKADLTLEHLLTKCSRLYGQTGISELHLLLYITPKGYQTHAVYMLRAHAISVKRRLSKNAHDVGAVFPWRRTAHRKE